MKVIQFVANISYNDISKLFSVLWIENAFENLINAVVQEFDIPPNEATEEILCDLEGTPHTKDSFEEDVSRSISEGKVPQFRVITPAHSDNTVTSSTSQSEYKENVEQQEPEEIDISSRVSNLFTNMRKFEDNLNMAENKFKVFKTKIESNIQGEPHMKEPTNPLHDPRADIEALQRELEDRKAKLDLFQKALLEFESRLKEREIALNQEDVELNNLRKMLNRRDEKLKNREVKVTGEESDLALQHYSMNKLKDMLYGLSSDMNEKREHLNQQEFGLHLKKSMLDEEKNKLKGGRIIVKPKGQMEVGANLHKKETETRVNEGASTSTQNRPQKLNVRVLIELKPKVTKRRGSASPIVSDDQEDKPRGPRTPPLDEQPMSMDFNEPSTSADQQINIRQTTRKYKTKKLSH